MSQTDMSPDIASGKLALVEGEELVSNMRRQLRTTNAYSRRSLLSELRPGIDRHLQS